jgi:hypothetical protein
MLSQIEGWLGGLRSAWPLFTHVQLSSITAQQSTIVGQSGGCDGVVTRTPARGRTIEWPHQDRPVIRQHAYRTEGESGGAIACPAASARHRNRHRPQAARSVPTDQLEPCADAADTRYDCQALIQAAGSSTDA